MPYRPTSKSTCLALLVLSLVTLSSPAFAGFQWVAPTEPEPMALPQSPLAPLPMEQPSLQPWPSDSMQPAPVTRAPASGTAVSEPEIITPVIIEGREPVQPVTGFTAPVVAPPPTVPPGTIVKGFAKQVPLAVALRQILPPGYGFSIDPDVDLGILVSFQGGKPWRDTLYTALEPAGLSMREQGQMINVSRIGSETMAPMAASPAPSLQPQTLQVPPGMVVAPSPVVMSEMPMASTPVVETWKAERGDSLRKVLESWSRRANAEFSWNAEYDYPMQASTNFSGTFEDAVRSLLVGFETANPQPVARLHVNANLGQMVLIVETRGNSYTD